MYQLTGNPDLVVCTDTAATIPRGHWMWAEYEQWLAEGNTPLPLVPPMSLSQALDAKKDAATAARWSHETGGVQIGGVRVGTTLDDQNRISGVLSAIALGGLESVDFKAASGWVRLSAAEIQGIAQAISAHVQACFSAERVHHEAIEMVDTLQGALSYDVTTGWPV